MNKAYFFRIAKHAWIDALRKKTVRPMPLTEEPIADPHEGDLNIRAAFEVMAERLSVRQSVLILMIDIFGFTARETASRIGSTEGAVKEALKRARQRLTRLAAEPDGYEQKKTTIHSSETMSHELMELFIDAFRSGNVHQIYRSYSTLRASGLDVAKVWVHEEYVYFDFLDPNGHLLRISSKTNFP